MSTVYLCQVRRAENPWYIEDVDLHIYSMEELCYFLCHNIALLDEDFFSDGLTEWIKNELRLRRLAQKLEGFGAEEEFHAAEYVLAILDEISYLNGPDRAELDKNIRELASMPFPIRKKRKADTLVEHKRYLRAIHAYQEILNMQKDSNLGSQFTGSVFNNMGVVYAEMFQMEEACDCMQKAYELLHTQGSMRNYLSCVFLNKGKEEYERLADEMGLDTAMRNELDKKITTMKPAPIPPDIDSALNRWVREYHKSTGQ